MQAGLDRDLRLRNRLAPSFQGRGSSLTPTGYLVPKCQKRSTPTSCAILGRGNVEARSRCIEEKYLIFRTKYDLAAVINHLVRSTKIS